MRVYASDVQSGRLRTYLFQFLPLTHSEMVATREIRDVSYVANPYLVLGGPISCKHEQATGHV